MSYEPPPPPPAPGYPTGTRPGVVTAAGVLLIVVGALGILGGLLVFALATVAAIFTILAVILLAVGALEL